MRRREDEGLHSRAAPKNSAVCMLLVHVVRLDSAVLLQALFLRAHRRFEAELSSLAVLFCISALLYDMYVNRETARNSDERRRVVLKGASDAGGCWVQVLSWLVGEIHG